MLINGIMVSESGSIIARSAIAVSLRMYIDDASESQLPTSAAELRQLRRRV